MAKDVYDTQEDCEKLLGSNKKERCTANKGIIDKIWKEDKRFCSFCSSISNSVFISENMCLTLLKVWQTLKKVR